MKSDQQPHQFSRVAEDLIADLRQVPNADPKRQRIRPTQRLDDVVADLVNKHKIGRESAVDTIREHWPAIVGNANASFSHPARLDFKDTTVVVISGHAVVRNELFIHRRAILQKITALPGCRGIKAINIQPG